MFEIKKYSFSLIILIIVFIIFVIVGIGDFREKQEIENNRVETVGFVTNATIRRSAQSVEYTYFFNNRKIEAIDTEQSGSLKRYVGKYFKIHLSSKNPNHSIILLNAEVTDSVLIKQAGFDIQ